MCENTFTQNKFVEFSPGLNVLKFITQFLSHTNFLHYA